MADGSNITAGSALADETAWRQIVLQYQKPSRWRALWQIADTIVPYGTIWYFMYLSLSVS